MRTKFSQAAWLVAGLTIAGAALRFATLTTQSYWLDEVSTENAVRGSLGDVLHNVKTGQLSPPLYYVVAWAWAKLFGTAPLALRSISAIAGTATIPVAYACGRALLTRRAGVVAAALVAASPFMVWYSQEARNYALLTLFVALSLLAFARALEAPTPRRLAAWAFASALAFATHYFAGFVILPEFAWLAIALRSRYVAAAGAAVVAVGAALLPLALDQRARGGAAWIPGRPLDMRVEGTARKFLVGETGGRIGHAVAITGVLALLGLALLAWHASADERRGALRAGAIAAAVLGVPFALALLGADYVDARNLIAAWVPCALVAAAGLGARRAGVAGVALTIALTGAFTWATLRMETDAKLQRDDWRGLARALGPRPGGGRAVVLTPFYLRETLLYYARTLVPSPPEAQPVSEIDVVAGPAASGAAPSLAGLAPPAGFQIVERRRVGDLELIRMRSPQPVPLDAGALAASAGPVGSSTVLRG